MRYQPTHAAPRETVPFALRGPKSVRALLSAAVAGAIGLTPAFMFASPAQAAVAGYAVTPTNPQFNEGSSQAYTVTRTGSGPAMAAETIYWKVGPAGSGASADDDDFTAVSGQVEFPADDTAPFSDQTQTITVNSVNDTMYEAAEGFTLTISKDSTFPPATSDTVAGAILDNDTAPTYALFIDNPSPDESIGYVTVTAELKAKSGVNTTIPISTQDGTAIKVRDYTALAGGTNLTIPAGSTTSVPMQILITADDIYEEKSQDFTVVGGTHSSVTGTDSAKVAIQDDDAQPEVTVDPTSIAEGSDLSFNVRLSGASERPVTATWNTADGPGKDADPSTLTGRGIAKAPGDYTAVSNGTVRFPGTVTTGAVLPTSENRLQAAKVRTIDDTVNELPEDMHVTLSAPAIAKLGEASVATGGITDSDPQPTVSLTSTGASVVEGNTGRKAQTYTMRLSGPSGKKITVDYSTTAGTAKEGEDYVGKFGTLVFEPGETSKTFDVWINGDIKAEADENFTIGLASGTATVPPAAVSNTVTIRNDDMAPTFSVSPITMPEGNTGTVVTMPIKLSNARDTNTSFAVAVNASPASTATSANGGPGFRDFAAPATPVVIPAGETTGYVYFLVNGDDVYETSETISLRLTPAPGALSSDAFKDVTVTLTNDDKAPDFEVISDTTMEGAEVQVRGVVTGVAQDNVVFNVGFRGASVNGSRAASAADFVDPGISTVTVPGGTFSGTQFTIGNEIEIVDDNDAEPAETVLGSGSGVGGIGTVTDGVITIAASDGGTTTPPTNPPTDPNNPTKPTLMASSQWVVPGGQVRLTGKAAPNTPVQLWSAPYNGGANDWDEDGGPVTTNAQGNFSIPRTLGELGRKYVVHVSETVKSDEVQVGVKLAPALSVSTPNRGQARLAVTGGMDSGWYLVQRNIGSGWSNVGEKRKLASNGDQFVTLTGQPSGRNVSYRVYVYGASNDGVQAATSPLKTVRIR